MVDEMCSTICTNRKTKRWPMCVFYNMLNLSVIDAYAVPVSNVKKKKTHGPARFRHEDRSPVHGALATTAILDCDFVEEI